MHSARSETPHSTHVHTPPADGAALLVPPPALPPLLAAPVPAAPVPLPPAAAPALLALDDDDDDVAGHALLVPPAPVPAPAPVVAGAAINIAAAAAVANAALAAPGRAPAAGRGAAAAGRGRGRGRGAAAPAGRVGIPAAGSLPHVRAALAADATGANNLSALRFSMSAKIPHRHAPAHAAVPSTHVPIGQPSSLPTHNLVMSAGNLLSTNTTSAAVGAARSSQVRNTTHLPDGMALVYLLLVPRADGTVPGYVGAATAPRARLLAHRRPGKSSRLLEAALRADGLTKDDVLYAPLDIVPVEHRDSSETLWTQRASPHGAASLNHFATFGNPAAARHFWLGRGRGRQQA